MKKYIDAEGLRATIEKIINSIESCPFIEAEFGAEMRREGKIQAYNKTLALIDSLQHEQPDVDLDEAFEKEYSKFSNDTDAGDYALPIDLTDYKDFALHFYELGKNSLK